jgi:E3 ubiquitin-protein ligase HERC4
MIENDDKKLFSYLEEDEINEKVDIYHKNTYIYGWGKNKYGELGVGNTLDVLEPTPIKSLHNLVIVQACSGGKHTALVTKDGKIYVCGTDVLGLLGNENKKWKEQHKFQKLNVLDSEYITQVACAEFHSLCLTHEGSVYAWGGNLHNVNFSLIF